MRIVWIHARQLVNTEVWIHDRREHASQNVDDVPGLVEVTCAIDRILRPDVGVPHNCFRVVVIVIVVLLLLLFVDVGGAAGKLVVVMIDLS